MVFLLVLPVASGCASEEAVAARSADQACLSAEVHDQSPETIEEVVGLINALPKPVTVPCLVRALERPLLVEASSNTFSAQPANGASDPRLFIFRDELVLSIATGGSGRELLELGARRSPTRSVKGELAFPITEEIPMAAPYDRIRRSDEGGTHCWPCHSDETRDTSLSHTIAFESQLVPPLSVYLVPLTAVEDAYRTCDPDTDPERCAIFDSVFEHGEVRHLSFDAW